MNPLRPLLLAALVYVFWRLLCRQLRGSIQAELLRRRQDEQEKQEATQDVLVEDPVCGVLIPKQEAVRLRQDGATYYFCSETCCDAFTGGTKGQDE